MRFFNELFSSRSKVSSKRVYSFVMVILVVILTLCVPFGIIVPLPLIGSLLGFILATMGISAIPSK